MKAVYAGAHRRLCGLSTVLLLLACLGASAAAQAEWVKAQQDIMGTRISLEFWHQGPQPAQPIVDAVMQIMKDVDQQLSPYIETSELYRVNRDAAKAPVYISGNFLALLKKSLWYSELSGGAFDITFASVGYLYDYRRHQAPDDKTISEKLPAIDYHHITLDEQQQTVFFTHPGVRIDLGGIAKGYAVDRGIDKLRQFGVQSAILSAGGDSRVLGDRRGVPWVIGIQHPRKKQQFATRIPLQDSAISTSGDYERYYLDGEVRIHHIINPKSGKSASQVTSVSILAPLAVDSDALSTTVFVLGVTDGLALINKLPGIDAVIIDGENRLHFSDGLLLAEPATQE